MRQEPLEVEVHGVRVGLGLERLLRGQDERAQTIDHLMENGGRDRDHRSTMPLAAGPARVSSVRLLALTCQKGSVGSDWYNNG